MAKAIFSVGAIPGKRSVRATWGDAVSQSEVAFDGPCRVVALGDTFWGGDKSRDFKTPVLQSPTWRKLLGVAGRQMDVTNDHHHAFLEGIYRAKDQPEPGVTHLVLALGS